LLILIRKLLPDPELLPPILSFAIFNLMPLGGECGVVITTGGICLIFSFGIVIRIGSGSLCLSLCL